MEIPHKKTGDGIVIQVRVQPRSSRSKIEVTGDKLKVWLKSPPLDNRANEELRELIAEELGINKGSVSIIRGLSSRDKVVLIKRAS